MDNLRGINSFVKAVEGNSIAAAARQLGITAAAASQNIARLEQAIGTRLLTRTTRRLALTESGEVYYAKVKRIVQDLELAQAEVAAMRGQAQGRLRVASSVTFGRHILAPLVPAFTAMHPKVALELIFSDHNVDHLKQNIDLSVRFKQQLEPGMIARHIATLPMLLCASPLYLERAGQPKNVEDLKYHDCLQFRLEVNGRLLNWGILQDGMRLEPELNPTIVCNDIDSLAQLAVAGAGITRLGYFVAAPFIASGQLVDIFQNKSGEKPASSIVAEPLDFYICYLDRHAVTLKMRVFIDHLLSNIRITAQDAIRSNN
ncbi:MAG: LysR family transcriptional regulator [Undibacterium sp.]|nr:LysR family transcriptional regulator [Undibacterium sp.]